MLLLIFYRVLINPLPYLTIFKHSRTEPIEHITIQLSSNGPYIVKRGKWLKDSAKFSVCFLFLLAILGVDPEQNLAKYKR